MSQSRPIVVGSRGSLLALAQTQEVISQLKALFPGFNFEVQRIRTQGDIMWRHPLPQIGGKGVFVKELEASLLKKEIDLAVHSFKDLPTELAPGLMIGAITRRQEARDALISSTSAPLDALPTGAAIGTSSPRRAAQLIACRPDLDIVNLRGNLDTRLRKVATGAIDAIVVAAAGLLRMGWQDKITQYLPPDICLPAVGQGALAIEIRQEDEDLAKMIQALDHEPSRRAITAERACLIHLGGGCHTPIAVFAQIIDGRIDLLGMVANPQGNRMVRSALLGQDGPPEEVGQRFAERLKGLGADEFLQEETE